MSEFEFFNNEDNILYGLKDKDKLVVQKSLPLYSLWQSDLTLCEFKILDLFLSRINSREPEHNTVVFEKGEIEEILGVTRIQKESLKERLKHLSSSVTIEDKNDPDRFLQLCLFERAYAKKDKNEGIWRVELTASNTAMKYFFNIETIGYLRYKLKCVTAIKSRYSYIMFCYLEANRFRKKWRISIEDLKDLLNYDNKNTEFKYFNRDVLKMIHAEINEKTECKYDYDIIRKNRKVVGIEIQLLNTNNELNIDQIEEKELRDFDL